MGVETESGLEAAWEEARVDQQMYMFVAIEHGEPIAFGQLVWLTNGLPYLGGAGTLRSARGRGAFRALVRARWDDAEAHGQSILLVQAGRMSSPILAGLGFRTVATLQTLDRLQRSTLISQEHRLVCRVKRRPAPVTPSGDDA